MNKSRRQSTLPSASPRRGKPREGGRLLRGGDIMHKITTIMVAGEAVEVDASIIDLLRVMNRIAGIEIMDGRDADPPPRPLAMIQFIGPGAAAFTLEMHSQMSRTLTIHRTYQKNALKLYHVFSITLGAQFVMQWSPGAYPLVLEAAREAARRIALDKEEEAQRMHDDAYDEHQAVTEKWWAVFEDAGQHLIDQNVDPENMIAHILRSSKRTLDEEMINGIKYVMQDEAEEGDQDDGPTN